MSWHDILKVSEVVWDFDMKAVGMYVPPALSRQMGMFYGLNKDEDGNMIAVASTATPVKKPDDTEYTFKLKLDI